MLNEENIACLVRMDIVKLDYVGCNRWQLFSQATGLTVRLMQNDRRRNGFREE